MKKLCLFVFFVSCSFNVLSSQGDFSLKYLSFVYHAYDPDYNGTEYFNNQFISLGYHFDSKNSFSIGTFKNSQDNRCFSAGLNREWVDFGNGWKFSGSYLYAGEFFLDAFSSCGDEGVYADIKDATGIGFAPYINHYFGYNFTGTTSAEFGLLFPGIVVINFNTDF
jgi:hypothetical protein